MAYRYQKELDLLEATKEELNITDAQYDELTSKMKDEGNAEWFKPWQEPQANIPGYEAEATFTREGNIITYKIKARNYAWNSFEPGLPFEIDIGKELNGSEYSINSDGTICMYCVDNLTSDGPSVITTSYVYENGKITGVTQANQVPEMSGQLYGQVLRGKFAINWHTADDEDLEHLKKNFKIKIG